ncbi:hypothetical protein SLEP1_g8009 [Rubroshorea leprosula]|uniref:Uncharacterized protein n=1 Tax=Rubroshorea leprosula TaxID=152421 RepID=A0AAV5I6G5_9ROSI|nr:hypothetical protein SLEP1_g8009 [Rubroshorea leprosula]
MIKVVMVMNKQGKISSGQILRLSAYGEAPRAYSRRLFSRAENVGNFVQADSMFGSLRKCRCRSLTCFQIIVAIVRLMN